MENQTYLIDAMVRVNKEIFNPKYVVHIADRGMIKAYLSDSHWIELYSYDRNLPEKGVQMVRSIYVSFSNDENGARAFYGKEAEGIWNHFSAVALTLSEDQDLTLDNLS